MSRRFSGEKAFLSRLIFFPLFKSVGMLHWLTRVLFSFSTNYIETSYLSIKCCVYLLFRFHLVLSKTLPCLNYIALAWLNFRLGLKCHDAGDNCKQNLATKCIIRPLKAYFISQRLPYAKHCSWKHENIGYFL